MPLILSNYTALAALHCLLDDTPYTVESIRTPAVLNKTEARKHYGDRMPLPRAPSPLTHIQMTKNRFKVFLHRLLRRKRSMQAMIYNSKEADLLLLMSSHMGQMGPL